MKRERKRAAAAILKKKEKKKEQPTTGSAQTQQAKPAFGLAYYGLFTRSNTHAVKETFPIAYARAP